MHRTYDCVNGGTGGLQTVLPANGKHPEWTIGSSVIVNFEFEPNADISKPLDLDTQLSGGATGTMRFSSYHLVPIHVTWKAIDGWTNVDDQIDPWTKKTNGKRIFPDYKTPKDTEIRHKLQVIVKTSPVLQGKTVYVKAFDVDDSTSEEFDRDKYVNSSTYGQIVIDTNGKAGEDNLTDYQGTQQNGQFWNETTSAWDGQTAHGIIDANGETKFYFRAGMQPGNNYRVIASVNNESMYAGVQTSDPTAPKYLGSELNQNGSAPASPLLTVWRRLWVENDSMKAIPVDPAPYIYKRNDLSSDIANPIVHARTLNSAGAGTVFSISPISAASSFLELEHGRIIVQSVTHDPVTGTERWR